MTLWLLSAYATSSDVKFSDDVRLCVRRDVAPTADEAEALLSPLAQASVRGGRDGQDWPMEISQVTVVEQPQIGIAGSDPALSGRLALHLGALEPVLIADDKVASLAGVDLLFMARSPGADGRRRRDRALVEAAARAGVRHVVLVSSSDAAPNAVSLRGSDAFDTEQALRGSGLAFTILRVGLTADEVVALADTEGVIRGAGGDGRIAVLSSFDVTRISTLVLSRPGDHLGQTYTLTGPDSLTLTEIAARLAVALDRALRYVDAPSTTHADLFAAIAGGAFSEASIDVELLGRWAPHELERAFEVF